MIYPSALGSRPPVPYKQRPIRTFYPSAPPIFLFGAPASSRHSAQSVSRGESPSGALQEKPGSKPRLRILPMNSMPARSALPSPPCSSLLAISSIPSAHHRGKQYPLFIDAADGSSRTVRSYTSKYSLRLHLSNRHALVISGS